MTVVIETTGPGFVDPSAEQHMVTMRDGVDLAIDVYLPAEPPSLRPLSALRVVLADLQTRGESASRIDLRGEEVIAVRPIPAAAAPADSAVTVQPHEPRRG